MCTSHNCHFLGSIGTSWLTIPDWWEHTLPISVQVYPPCLLTMPNYSKQKKDWYSPPFYTGPRGYRMCLRVRPVGQGSGLGSHVSVFIHLMRSENDDGLKWPLSAEFKVQVVNIREDKNHIEFTIPFNVNKAQGACGRVCVDGNICTTGIGTSQFIRHSDLRFNVSKNTEYLRNDYILFRIVSVNVLS